MIQGKHLNRFLKKDHTRYSKLFGIVLLCLSSTVVRIAPITAPRQAEKILLESLFGCASSPCLQVETYVVRTAASLRMTAVAEFCHCVHTKCSTRSGLVGWWRMHQTCLVFVCTRDILVQVLVFLVLQLTNDKIISVKWQSVSARHRIPIENTTAMVDRRTSRPQNIVDIAGEPVVFERRDLPRTHNSSTSRRGSSSLRRS